MLQLLCGLIVAVAFLVLQVWCQPYHMPSNNFLAMAGNVSIVLKFISSVGVQVNSLYGGTVDEQFLTVALFLAAFTVFAIALLQLLLAVRSQRLATADGASIFSRVAAAFNAVAASFSRSRTAAAAVPAATEPLVEENRRSAAINTA